VCLFVYSRTAPPFAFVSRGARVHPFLCVFFLSRRRFAFVFSASLGLCGSERSLPKRRRLCAVFFHARQGSAAAAARDPFFRVIFPLVVSSCVGLGWCNRFKHPHQIEFSTGFGFGCAAVAGCVLPSLRSGFPAPCRSPAESAQSSLALLLLSSQWNAQIPRSARILPLHSGDFQHHIHRQCVCSSRVFRAADLSA
jgi:hypothetical protein